MGTGNWSLRGGETVMIEPDNDDPFWWEDFKTNLRECLSVVWCETLDTWRGRDGHVLFRSSLHEIVTHVDSYDHVFVCYVPIENLERPELAAPHTARWAQAVFDKLQKFYPDMYVATSAWTSTKRLTQEERIANAL